MDSPKRQRTAEEEEERVRDDRKWVDADGKECEEKDAAMTKRAFKSLGEHIVRMKESRSEFNEVLEEVKRHMAVRDGENRSVCTVAGLTHDEWLATLFVCPSAIWTYWKLGGPCGRCFRAFAEPLVRDFDFLKEKQKMKRRCRDYDKDVFHSMSFMLHRACME
jgi:hypothetical protein